MRVAVVTGAGSGIGKSLSRALLGKGLSVAMLEVNEDALAETSSEFEASHPGKTTSHVVDVRDETAVGAAVQATVENVGPIDLLVNNAGVPIGGAGHLLTTEHWQRAVDINLMGVVHGINAVLPGMVARGSGRIVNIASLAGLIPMPYGAPYTATKHAVVGMTLSLRVEYAQSGINFQAVCPGFTDTNILDAGNPADLSPAGAPPVRKLAEKVPGGIYPLDSLTEDIMVGIASGKPLIVTPTSARATWRTFRWAPSIYLKKVTEMMSK